MAAFFVFVFFSRNKGNLLSYMSYEMSFHVNINMPVQIIEMFNLINTGKLIMF